MSSSAFDKNIKGTSWWSSISKGWAGCWLYTRRDGYPDPAPTTEATTSTPSGSTVVSTPSGSTVTSTPPSVDFSGPQKVPIAPLPTLEDIHADIMRIVPSPESTPTQPVEP